MRKICIIERYFFFFFFFFFFFVHKKVKPSHFHDVIEKKCLSYTQKKIISWFRKC